MLPDELELILERTEDYGLELKEARNSFSFDKLVEYCAALSNVDGGYVVLGVKDDHTVSGTSAFKGTYHGLANKLFTRLRIDVKVFEIDCDGKRVLVFEVPRHASGCPVSVDGKYLTRLGSSLTEMPTEQLRRVFAETESDFSAQYCDDAKVADLRLDAIEKLRKLWAKKSGNDSVLGKSDRQVLGDLRLIDGRRVTYAALILLGTDEAVAKYVPMSELVFEWRQDAHKVAYDYRKEWREALIFACDELWAEIDVRNIRYDVTEGLYKGDVWAFNKDVIREAIINAVAHRDYHLYAHSIWVKASSQCFRIESPGGLAPGVTLENIFDKSVWRNRLLSDTLQRIGWMEQSSQGIDTIFQSTIEEGKGAPILAADDYSVTLDINVVVIDRNFISFINNVVGEKHIALSTREVIELDRIRNENGVKSPSFKEKLLRDGLIEPGGHGAGTMYFLTKEYYSFTGKVGEYTRMRGLSAETKRSLIVKHLRENGKINAKELGQMFPELNYQQRYNLMRPLIGDGKVVHVGEKRSGFWELV